MAEPRARSAVGGAPAATLHVVTPDDWASHRELRLEMLQDAPDAFWTQYSDVAGFDEAAWRARIAAQYHVQARIDGRPVGSVGVWDDPDTAADVVSLVAMYVRPDARGHGVGRQLVQAVLDEARRRGKGRVLLEVTSNNEPAKRLYDGMGFSPNGVRRPHPRRPDLEELEMERPVAT